MNEYYHVYNRGAHKALIFHDRSDYLRFLSLLYIANDEKHLRFYNLDSSTLYSYDRKNILVYIIAYCLMPNHFHLVISEVSKKGISKFMKKICVAYSMYYNIKYQHSGTIIQGKYKRKYVDNDEYFRYLIQYVHLNPFGIKEPDVMRTAKKEFIEDAVMYACKYEFSSFKDYLGENREQGVILNKIRPY